MRNGGFKFEVQRGGASNTGTAKRLRLKAQGCFNPGGKSRLVTNPERVAPTDATALRLNRLSSPVAQGSRSVNPGL